MTVRFEWHGEAIKRAISNRRGDLLHDGAEFLLEEANRTVPIEEGILQGSGSTDVAGDEASIFYDTPYAVRLHENPQYHFQHGRRGKWLALTLGEQKERVQRFFADGMRRVFR